MLLIKLFRLKSKKTIGFFLLIFLLSFGLQTSQDILTRLDSFKNIDLHQTEFSKNIKTFDQTNIADDDQEVREHHQLDLIHIFDRQLFHSSLLSFNNILDHGTNQFYDDQTLAPSSRLFLFNRTLRI